MQQEKGQEMMKDPQAKITDPQERIKQIIHRQCSDAGSGQSVCPNDIARAFAAERGEAGLAWQHWLPPVRRGAVSLAMQGDIVVYRKGKPVDPQDFRGVYRLGLPRQD